MTVTKAARSSRSRIHGLSMVQVQHIRTATIESMTEGLTKGQNVSIKIDGEQVDGVFVRPGEPDEAITLESPGIEGPYKRDVAWVQRNDTRDIEPFEYRLVLSA